MNRATLALSLLLTACSKQPSEGAPPHVSEAAPPPRIDAAPAAPPVVEHDPEPVDASIVDAASPVAAEPAPKVKVISIGMHVAGGPYDEETKKPFLAAVEPHYPELARCWRHVKQPRQADVGVDVLIPASGGKARISNPRSTIEGEGFLPCVVGFFEGIEWGKPKSGGPQGLSYSVRFKP